RCICSWAGLNFHDALATPPIMKVSGKFIAPHPLPPPWGGGVKVLATLEAVASAYRRISS
ncbi:MAG: hypothetical protein ACM31P_00295, partial [Actinomycetota bacterium]